MKSAFTLFCLYMFCFSLFAATEPLTIFGNASVVNGSTFSPSVGMDLPVKGLTMPFEMLHQPGSNVLMTGIKQRVMHVTVNGHVLDGTLAAQFGASTDAQLAMAFTAGVTKDLGKGWSVGPDLRYIQIGPSSGLAVGFGIFKAVP